ncbi:MAG: 4-hydroxybenzoate octaprenyltransferase [Rhodomicrobium sp.]
MRTISAGAHGKSGGEGAGAGPLADAPPSNWVDRFAPDGLKPWLRLVRADRPVGAYLLMWPCWWSVALSVRAEDDIPDIWSDIRLLLLFTVGAFVMRSAGCIYNDIIDRDIDAKVARTRGRPLASGQISVGAAVVCALALCLVGLAVLLQFNTFAVALGFGSVGIVLIYPLMKRVTFWPQAVLGLAFSYGALMGWAAYWGDLALAPIVLYAAAVAWTIGYDTIYAHQDKEDDILVGLKSTALRFGNSTPAWLSLFFGITIGGLAFAGWSVGAGLWFYCGLVLAATHLVWQVATLNTDDPENCLQRFRSNHHFGAIVFLAIVADIIPAALR